MSVGAEGAIRILVGLLAWLTWPAIVLVDRHAISLGNIAELPFFRTWATIYVGWWFIRCFTYLSFVRGLGDAWPAEGAFETEAISTWIFYLLALFMSIHYFGMDTFTNALLFGGALAGATVASSIVALLAGKVVGCCS